MSGYLGLGGKRALVTGGIPCGFLNRACLLGKKARKQ
jgi:hypothetical protein